MPPPEWLWVKGAYKGVYTEMREDGPWTALDLAEHPLFVTYQMADGSQVAGEYAFVTDTEWFEERDEEIRVIKKTYYLVHEEEVVFPDPYPIEDEELEDGD